MCAARLRTCGEIDDVWVTGQRTLMKMDKCCARKSANNVHKYHVLLQITWPPFAAKLWLRATKDMHEAVVFNVSMCSEACECASERARDREGGLNQTMWVLLVSKWCEFERVDHRLCSDHSTGCSASPQVGRNGESRSNLSDIYAADTATVVLLLLCVGAAAAISIKRNCRYYTLVAILVLPSLNFKLNNPRL